MWPFLENPDQVLQETGNSQGPTHSKLAECGGKLSRLGQVIQTEWYLLPDVFQLICTKWHQPQVDLFAMKLIRFVSPVPNFLPMAVDALSLPWDYLDPYACPPKISLVFWIVSIESDLRVAEASPLGTFSWSYTSLQRLLLNP